MKTFLFTLFTTAIAPFAFAQEPDKALIRVKYAFSHVRDTTDRENYYRENMMLIAGKNASVYLSYDKIIQDIEAKEAFEKQKRQQANVETPTFVSPPKKRQSNSMEIFYFANRHKFIIKEQLVAFYLTEEKVEKIDWKISTDTRIIEGLNCKKATGYFRGRNWTAWFAEELPFSTGPWKLVGLPGLIVEAYDEDAEVSFIFLGLEKIDEKAKPVKNPSNDYTIKKIGSSNVHSETEIQLPPDAIKATPEEIKKLKETRDKDPKKFLQTQMELVGLGSLKQVSPGKNTGVPAQMPVFNNPIERPKSLHPYP
jgi:GLPGLI family protein